MIVKVSMAKSDSDVIPTPKDFEELYDIYVPQRWNQLTEEERAELISKTMNGVLLPLVMMIDKNPSFGQINWSGQSHDVAWRCYDFGQKNRIWIQVGLLNSESGIGFGISK